MLHLKQLLLKEVEMDKTVLAERVCMSNNNYITTITYRIKESSESGLKKQEARLENCWSLTSIDTWTKKQKTDNEKKIALNFLF